ncbi:acetyl-CoA carboxylase, carboxyl transferase, alpha subunit [Candidatus Endolissoclinum faulkneri L5]|uniref:Acetyl-coenzyme A carboxylase carboxyl transferase subunit alpha n=1 Tax=Candidatus Endolissoclinum faulkneri L5 TaxID=1401328 RepID=V9TSH7_9PROT|nr:acetyl-CoA carboxylase carboxyltransferase subunit alpha [Candidatus Endolissoclinum faulkneri]AHC73546.1 acetyl-CoA carboxylase, carboxyl transferase, alpha subunit [Candidatus Endolissoclinum faulkneri L5]
MHNFLDFEKPIADLEYKIEKLRHLPSDNELKIAEEVSKLETKIKQQLTIIYQKLSPWQKVQIARHPERPHAQAVINHIISEYLPLAGDRLFSEDPAIVGGIGRFKGRSVIVIGTEKGNTTEERVRHNFGMARPEGYRKARRLMKFADRFKMPILTFIDTAGAYPGIDAEERGQAEAIARSIETCLNVQVPLIATILGEGGSGGAVALAAGNKVLMLEHAIYSVISPEGCASILWRSAEHAKEAANALKITAQNLKKLGVIDDIVKEPLGGAHRDHNRALLAVEEAIDQHLNELIGREGHLLREERRNKYMAIGEAEDAKINT